MFCSLIQILSFSKQKKKKKNTCKFFDFPTYYQNCRSSFWIVIYFQKLMYPWYYNKVWIKVSKNIYTWNDTEEKINVRRGKISQKVNTTWILTTEKRQKTLKILDSYKLPIVDWNLISYHKMDQQKS